MNTLATLTILVSLIGIMVGLALVSSNPVIQHLDTQIRAGFDTANLQLTQAHKRLVTARMYMVGVLLALMTSGLMLVYLMSVK